LATRQRRSSTSINSSAGTAKKHDFAGEIFGNPGLAQRQRRAQHAGDLGVVAAAVRGTGNGIGERVLGSAQAVQLADKRHPRARPVPLEPGLDPSQCQTGLRHQAERREPLGNQRRGPGLVKAGFGMAQNGFAEPDNRLAVPIYRRAHGALHFVLAGHSRSSAACRRLALYGSRACTAKPIFPCVGGDRRPDLVIVNFPSAIVAKRPAQQRFLLSAASINRQFSFHSIHL
jgi:hypothetical protein